MITILVYGSYNKNNTTYKYAIIKDNNIILKLNKHIYNNKKSAGKEPTAIARGLYHALIYCEDNKLNEEIRIITNSEIFTYIVNNQYKYKDFIHFANVFSKLNDKEYSIESDKNLEKTVMNIFECNGINEHKNTLIYQVYVDGSFDKVTSYYGWAFAIYENGKLIKKDFGKDSIASAVWNVVGELSATMRAVAWCYNNYIDFINIHYDYEGIEKWARNKWKAKNHWTQIYKDFMEEYLRLMKIDFTKVKAHSGMTKNEFVDGLAKEALKNG